jgi:hypothetical protein
MIRASIALIIGLILGYIFAPNDLGVQLMIGYLCFFTFFILSVIIK